jgi:hypothetical protein
MSSRRSQVHFQSHQNLLRKKRLSHCAGLQPRLRKKQKEICPMEFRSQARRHGHKSLFTGGNYIDVSAFVPGSAVKDPYTEKIFLMP